MDEEKKVVFVSHCILNQNVRDKKFSGTKDLIELFTGSDVGIIQLPCPEVESNRVLNNKINEECGNYREYCREISVKILKTIRKYLDAEFKVVGILGIEFSPICGVHRINNGKKVVPGKGILIEELENEMQKQRFQVPIIATNLNNIFPTLERVDLLLKNC